MLNPNNLEKRRIQTREQILYNFAQILDNFPQYTTSQHLVLLLRRKNPNAKDIYDWTDEEFLSKLEKYVDELSNDLSQERVFEEDNN